MSSSSTAAAIPYYRERVRSDERREEREEVEAMRTYPEGDHGQEQREEPARLAVSSLVADLLPIVALFLGLGQEGSDQEGRPDRHADQHVGVVGEATGSVGVVEGILVVNVHGVAGTIIVAVAADGFHRGEQLRRDDPVHRLRGIAHAHDEFVGSGLLPRSSQLDDGHRVEHLGQSLHEILIPQTHSRDN